MGIGKNLTKPTTFKQQRLRACQPILTPVLVIVVFFVVGIVFVPIGAGLLVASNSLGYVEMRYDNLPECAMGTECHLQFTNLSLKAPVYMYYKLNNFYQNHRRSRSDDQLNGVVITATNKVPDCAPYASLNDSSDINLLYQPCGLIAHSTFNDSFILSSNNGTIIPLQKQGIAWPSDLDKFHNQPAGVAGIRVIPDVTDEDFIVWMRTAALPTFKKLYRVINEDMTGDYTVAVRNHFPVAAYSGQKAVVFAETNALGGKNPFLGYAYIVVGGLCFLLGIIFLIQHLIGGRKLGDIDYLKWHTE